MPEIHDLYLDAVKIAVILADKGELRGMIHDNSDNYSITVTITVPKKREEK